MIGKVIEGRYAGANVNKVPDKNILFIQTEDGTKIALSKSNVISIDDVTEQYPSGGQKVLMVMWNDFETSVIRLGKPPLTVPKCAAMDDRKNITQTVSTKRSKNKMLVISLVFVSILLVFLVALVLNNLLSSKPQNDSVRPIPTTVEAPSQTTIPEITVPETSVQTEILIEYADEAFLESIELSVAKRNQLLQTDFKQYELINMEFAIIGEFENAEFRDSELYALARQYLSGLYLQKEALNLTHSEKQIQWQEGVVERYSALISLHDQYNVFADDPDFVSTYVLEQEKNIRVLQALKEVEADLVAQLDGVTLQYKSQNKYTATYTNNTDYDFDINFYFWYYDANGTRIDEWSTYFTNILPKKHTIFEFWCPSTGKTFDFEWDIILPEMRQ